MIWLGPVWSNLETTLQYIYNQKIIVDAGTNVIDGTSVMDAKPKEVCITRNRGKQVSSVQNLNDDGKITMKPMAKSTQPNKVSKNSHASNIEP